MSSLVCMQVYITGTAVGGLGLALQPHKGVSQAYRPLPELGQDGEVEKVCESKCGFLTYTWQ